jgi:hypothetical protein
MMLKTCGRTSAAWPQVSCYLKHPSVAQECREVESELVVRLILSSVDDAQVGAM